MGEEVQGTHLGMARVQTNKVSLKVVKCAMYIAT